MNKKFSTAWIKVPIALLNDPTISVIEANIYAVMLDRADQTLTVKISQSEIANVLKINRITVYRAINKLKDGKWIWTDKTEEQPHDKLTYHLREIIPSKNKKKSNKDQW